MRRQGREGERERRKAKRKQEKIKCHSISKKKKLLSTQYNDDGWPFSQSRKIKREQNRIVYLLRGENDAKPYIAHAKKENRRNSIKSKLKRRKLHEVRDSNNIFSFQSFRSSMLCGFFPSHFSIIWMATILFREKSVGQLICYSICTHIWCSVLALNQFDFQWIINFLDVSRLLSTHAHIQTQITLLNICWLWDLRSQKISIYIRHNTYEIIWLK